jgi:membrane protein required for colicin V production
MHILDILFVVIGIISIIIGIRRGLVSELFRLLALLAGFLSAYLYSRRGAEYLTSVPKQLASTLSFIIIFIAAALIVLGIGWVIRKMVHLTPLGWIDSLFGGVIGLLKTFTFFWMLCLGFTLFPFTISKLTLHHSLVFQTYRKLPGCLKLSGLAELRGMLKIDPVPATQHHSLKKEHAGETLERRGDSTAKVI